MLKSRYDVSDVCLAQSSKSSLYCCLLVGTDLCNGVSEASKRLLCAHGKLVIGW